MASDATRYDVVTTPSFDARLDEVLLYRVTFHGVRSAEKVLSALETLSVSLGSMPGMGSNLNARDSGGFQLRWAAADSYIVVYSIHEDEMTVLLQDLFYKSQNWREIIEG